MYENEKKKKKKPVAFFSLFITKMGVCASISLKSNKNDPESQKSKSIDKQIKADEKRLRSEVKVLLLGRKLSLIFA